MIIRYTVLIDVHNAFLYIYIDRNTATFIRIFIRSTVPPENMTISKKIINVTVDTIPETVTCNAKALPEPTFRWFREGSTDIIVEGRVLDLKVPIPRRSNGTYYCEASNRHGTKNISLIMNVQCK